MISTHILDLQSGAPAPGVHVRLDRREGAAWKKIAEIPTDLDGRVVFSHTVEAGTYQLTFLVKSPFFSEIPVLFDVVDPARKLHIPLLLSPYGYSTYRGS